MLTYFSYCSNLWHIYMKKLWSVVICSAVAYTKSFLFLFVSGSLFIFSTKVLLRQYFALPDVVLSALGETISLSVIYHGQGWCSLNLLQADEGDVDWLKWVGEIKDHGLSCDEACTPWIKWWDCPFLLDSDYLGQLQAVLINVTAFLLVDWVLNIKGALKYIYLFHPSLSGSLRIALRYPYIFIIKSETYCSWFVMHF